MIICDSKRCMACQVCKIECPQNAISFKNDSVGNLIPVIDTKLCIECQKCKKICPNNNELAVFEPKKAFAAWNPNSNERDKAASGGVASFLQRRAIENDIITYGVAFEVIPTLRYFEINSLEELDKAKNSKYVYSPAYQVFNNLKKQLNQGKKVLFIGVPCQIAALKKYVGDNKCNNLILIDLVCHGMPPALFFQEHYEALEKKYNQIKDIKFRIRNNYDWVITDKQGNHYIRKCYKDVYAVGFHGAAIYQEGCYNCRYASASRISDITLGDFWGVENDVLLKEEYKKGITAVLINTEKGYDFFAEYGKDLYKTPRNPMEIIKNNGQLQTPPQKPRERKKFLKKYKKCGFEKAALKSFKIMALKQRVNSLKIVKKVKRKLKKLLFKNAEKVYL